jgi:hypothetical protein
MVGGGLIVAVAAAAARFRDFRRPRSLWMFLPFAIYLIILVSGVYFRDSRYPQILMSIVRGLFWIQAPMAIVLLIVFRSHWLTVVGISLAAAWLAYGATFMAAMSITGVWL